MSIELRIERTIAGSVAPGANVIFDLNPLLSGNISYNPVTGVITFNETGTYIINWFVVTQATFSSDGVVFALSSSTGDFIEGNSHLVTGEVSGFGIIDVVVPGKTLSLVNATTEDIVYSSIVPVKASLMLFQETSQTGPTGATGATGPTGPTGASGPIGPTGAFILGKQTACKNAVALNRVRMGIEPNVFIYSAVLISKLQLDIDIAVFVYLDLLHKLNQNLSCQFVDVFMFSKGC